MNNTNSTNEENKFLWRYPLVAQSLPLKTTVVAGDVIGRC